MKSMVNKAWTDLRSSPSRTLLAILALAVGLWGVGGILVSYTILMRDLNENFTRTRPAHAAIVSADLERLELSALRARPEIESAELRDLSLQRIEVHPGDWIPLWLFGVEDFDHPSLASIRREKGAAVPPAGTMLMERDGRLISDLDLGSLARVRARRRIVNVLVSGIAFDPAQAPATQDHFIYAYADKQTYADITGERANHRLIVRFKDVASKREMETALRGTVAYLESSGIRVSGVNVPKLNEHPHQWQLNTLLFLQGGIGFLAFVMGAVLVSQLMAAILAAQAREIGIMKAIGARRSQVFAIYLTMVLVLGIASGLIAVPLAIASGYAFSYFVAGKLNFDILTLHLPAYVYVALVAASLLQPVLMSLPSIVRGMRLSVHEALRDYGIPPTVNSRSFSVSCLPPWLLLAARNGARRKKRLMVTVLAMALGVAIFSTGFNVRQSLAVLLAEYDRSMKHDVQVVLAEPIARQRALAPFADIGNIARVETWNGGRGELQSRIVSTHRGVGIVALPYDTDLFHPRLVQGRWLQVNDPPEIVMNQQAAELFGNPDVGDDVAVAIGGTTMTARLVGVVEEIEKAKVYIDQTQYDALANPKHLVNSLMFVAQDKGYASVMTLKQRIESAIASTDLDVLYVMAQAERVKIIYDHLNIILTTIVFLSLLVLIVSALGMASAMAIGIRERTREIGVMRSIGATPKAIFRIFVTEGMIITVASVALGLVLAWPLSRLAAVFFGNLMLGEGATLRYAFSMPGFWIVLAATVAFGWLASRLPARRAVRIPAHSALAYE